MGERTRLLIVEDSPEDAHLVVRALEKSGFSLDWSCVQTLPELREALDGSEWDIVLCDHQLPGWDSVVAFEAVRDRGIDIPFVIVSGRMEWDEAVEAMRAGVTDFVRKGDLPRLVPVVERVLRVYREKHALEGQLRQAQRMEAVGRLAGGVAHDFNNMLTVISTFAGFVREELSPGDPRLADLDEVVRAADRATRLTRQLLAFSRRQPIEPRILDLNELILNVDKMLRRTLGEDIELVTLPASELGRVHVDPGQFEHALLNLAVNARDAMPEGGTLTIQTHNDGDQWVRLTVCDTGIGMDQETCVQIFEPFFTTKAVGEGTGLGLSTCYGIVTQAGGQIDVTSEVGGGTQFQIILPRAAAAEYVPAEPTGPLPSLQTEVHELVMVVEDEPAVLRLTTRVLQRGGYRVLKASNGHEALRVFEAHPDPIDLLITDMVMPKMSGRELAGRLVKLSPSTRVLFITGYSPDAVEDDGGDPLLTKPFTDKQLLRKVRQVLIEAGERGAGRGDD